MADDTQTVPEPSMEEILASIRKIIADENSPKPAEDVVELTQMVQDDGSVVDLTDMPAAEPPPAPEPATAAPSQQPPPPPSRPSAPLPPVSGDTLLSDSKASEAASSFSALADTLAIDRFASGMSGGTYIGHGGRTLEDLVAELLRPMLKQWLDQNLPATVDRLVQREIERIGRRAKD